MKPDSVSSGHWWTYNMLFFLEHFLGQKFYQKHFQALEGQLFAKIKEEMKSAPKKIEGPLFDEFFPGEEEIIGPDRVQVFRGKAKNWNCMERWSLEFFANEYGDQKITILNSEGLFQPGIQELGETTMKDYIEQVKSGSKVYLKFSPIVHHESALREDFDYDWMEKFSFFSAFGRKAFLFIGGENTLTPIHNALSNTIFVQVHGQKKWTFYYPEDRLFIGARPERRNYFFSRMDKDAPDSQKFPLNGFARKFEITLEPGDAMYFPAFFWHHVDNPGTSIGVAYKSAHMPSALKSSTALTLLSFLSTKPFLLDSLIRTGFKSNERVFLD